MVVPSERSCYLFDFRYSYLIRYAVTFDYTDGVFKEFVAVLDGYVFYKDCVGFRRFLRVQGVHVIIACSLLKDVDTIVLNVAEIDSINRYITNRLRYYLGAAAGAAHKESYTKDEGEQEPLNEAVKLTQRWIRILTECWNIHEQWDLV